MREPPSAVGAAIRLLSGVDALVYLEVTLPFETLPALGAVEGLLVCVNALVQVQSAFSAETLPTL